LSDLIDRVEALEKYLGIIPLDAEVQDTPGNGEAGV